MWSWIELRCGFCSNEMERRRDGLCLILLYNPSFVPYSVLPSVLIPIASNDTTGYCLTIQYNILLFSLANLLQM